MASSSSSNDLQEVLKPFYQRASQAEVGKQTLSPLNIDNEKKEEKSNNDIRVDVQDRLARLEATLSSTKDSGNGELSKKVAELQSQLEDAKAELALEREKSLKDAQQLAAENAKLQYRIIHLVRALKEADSKLASK